MKNVIEAFVNRSRATILILAVLLIVGFFDYQKIPKESTPDVRVPVIYVLVTLQGISPEDAERLLLRPLENSLRSIEGIKEMTSYASEGSASVIMEFNAGFDSDKAIRDVRNKVDDVSNLLPKESDKPRIHEVNLSLFPVLNIILSGNIPERTLLQHARDLKDKIEAVPGILEVKIGGERRDSLEVIVDPKNLEANGLSIAAIKQVVDSNNKLVAAGSIRNSTGEFAVKVPSLVQSLDSLLDYPIKVNGNDVMRVRDVAEIRRTYKDPDNVAHVNGYPSVVLEVSKRTGENIILTVDKIKKLIEYEKKYWPEKLEVIYSQDNSQSILEMVADLENNIIFGVILVLLVVVYAVGPKSALLISLSIPFSFLAGITFLSIMGYTLNIVVLFSLILTVGMIVDDAIVVSEYADRIMHEGIPPSRAYLIAAKRMLWPIFTSTLVKILVFLPLLVWPGVVGQFMKFMPITVIAILTNSLLFALFFQPTLGPMFGKPGQEDSETITSIKAADKGDYESVKGMTKVYMLALKRILRFPKIFVGLILALLVVVNLIFAVFGPGFEFFPKIEPESVMITVQAPGNLSLSERREIMQAVDSRLLKFKEEIKIIYSKAGKFENENSFPQDTIGTIFLEFVNWQDRRKAKLIIEDILRTSSGIEGIKIEVLENKEGPPAEKPVQINLTSRSSEALSVGADALKHLMHNIGGFKDIEDSRSSKAIEWRILVDREKAAKYALDIGTIGNTIQLATNGLKISSYRPDDVTDEVDILLRFPEASRNINIFEKMNVATPEDNVVPISSFIRVEPGLQLSKIKRVNRERVITIKSNIQEGFLADTQVSQIKEMISSNNFIELVQQIAKSNGLDLPVTVFSDLKLHFKGEDQDQQEAAAFLKNAFLLTLVMMFIVMLVQFNNVYHTIVIMSAVFLSTVGVILGLLVTYQPFGVVMCGIGIIALGGIVLNNNILFIDTYQYLRKEGVRCEEAIISSGIQRLRPILLTATTAVLGLLPMVFGITISFTEREILFDAPSSQWWRQLSASIAGGLTFATILTLFFTPCLLLIGKKFDVSETKETPER